MSTNHDGNLILAYLQILDVFFPVLVFCILFTLLFFGYKYQTGRSAAPQLELNECKQPDWARDG